MLRSSLLLFIETIPSNSEIKADAIFNLTKNEFHNRLRSEIVMMPIPKPSVMHHKLIGHQNKETLIDEIIDKQLHNLEFAILRVSSSLIRNHSITFSFKLIFPSACETTGIMMLQSVRNILNQIRCPINQIILSSHKLSDCHMLRKHLSSKNIICPTITAYQFNNYPSDPYDVNVHVMVATGITTKKIDGKAEDFVQCKNSYRSDLSIPGKG